MTIQNTLEPNFNVPTSQINIQVYKIGTTLHMGDGFIMKSRKSHYREATYHAYSTYMQTSKQAFRDQKPIKKEQKTPKTKKTTQKLKIFHNL